MKAVLVTGKDTLAPIGKCLCPPNLMPIRIIRLAVWLTECLPKMHEDLGLIPSIT